MQSKTLCNFCKGASKEHKPLLEALILKLDKKMPLEELEEVCLRWASMFAMKDLVYIRPPLEPQVVTEFMKNTISKRRKLFENDTELRQEVLAFRSRYVGTVNRNKTCKIYLKRMLSFFKGKGEMEKVTSVEQALATY